MTSWISREEAFKVAKVTAFDAKRYLSIFYRFAPPDAITRGKKFSPLVPQICQAFLKMSQKTSNISTGIPVLFHTSK